MHSPIMRQSTNRTIRSLLVLLVAMSMPVSSAEPPDRAPVDSTELANYAAAINKAGRQRMLTQRITKSHCLSGMVRDPFIAGIQRFHVQTNLAVSMFEQQLSELKAFQLNFDIGIALDDVATQWDAFKALALSRPTRHSCQRLSMLDEDLLRASERVVFLLQDAMGTSLARLVNISGRQRMLSQRLAKFYALRAWRLAGAAGSASLEQARNEFEGALVTLRDAPENTPAIRRKLGQIGEQWVWLKGALDLHAAGFPIIVNDAGEKTLHLMEDLTQLYAGLQTPR